MARTPGPATPTDAPVAAATCVEAVETFFAPLLASLARSADAIAPLFDGPPIASDIVLREVEPRARDVLAAGPAVGAGFVVIPGLLSDLTHLLAWWQGDAGERMAESAALVQSAEYAHQEWFRTPLRTGEVHVTGPYVDYVCTDEFVLTTTLPVVRAGRPLGVMGVDVLAETLERVLAPTFIAAGATLVNHHSRAAVSGDPTVFAGDRIDRSAFALALPCAGLPLTVLA
ncbi:cache domain-containing protein [Nocardioides sp.]|uniref:cache domain-containing protein n=1 Tax=Nocardioides sp. TaxID=35761 RepID=UPI003511A49F